MQVDFESELARDTFNRLAMDEEVRINTGSSHATTIPLIMSVSYQKIRSENAYYNDQIEMCDTNNDTLITEEEAFIYRGESIVVDHELATVESPTVESPTVESPTVESPTVESPTVESPTVESPTVESPTVESPAVETPAVETPTEKTEEKTKTTAAKEPPTATPAAKATSAKPVSTASGAAEK